VNHVHWWLFALSFFLGLGLTFTLLKYGRSGGPAEAAETPTTKIDVVEDPPTTRIHVAQDPPTTKIRVTQGTQDPPTSKIPVENPTRKIPAVPYAPYGPGSARASAGGGGPAGWLVKGRSDTRLYYTPDDATYDRTVAQVWFKDEESAKRAYFTAWRKSAKK
jgi:uncharacterized membrane protein ArfC